jgi:hypothetical protein
MKLSTFAAAFGVACLVATSAFATDAAAPAGSPSPTPTASSAMKPDKPDKAAMEAKSQECSKEADAKGLHGKERKKFREKCKKGDK